MTSPASTRNTRIPAQTSNFLRPTTLHRYDCGMLQQVPDMVAVEETLHIHASGLPPMHLERTPGDDENLVAGHLLCTGAIQGREDILSITVSAESDRAKVFFTPPGNRTRCMPPRPERGAVDMHRFFEFKRAFERRQQLFRNTGASHAAALFSLNGEMVAFGEDVSRHNAFDKAVGRAMLGGQLHRASIAMLSSRLALELVNKADTVGIPILCGFSVATSSAVHQAAERDITLVGRIRQDTMNIYTCSWPLDEI